MLKLIATAVLALTLVACVTPGNMSDFPSRYRAEMGALTATRQSTALLVLSGTLGRDAGAKVLADTDQAAALLSTARMVEAPFDTTLDSLASADAAARAALVAALAAPK